MGKTKNRRSAFVALCFALMVCMLAVVLISVPIQEIPSSAEASTPLTVEGNKGIWTDNAFEESNGLSFKISGTAKEIDTQATSGNTTLTLTFSGKGYITFDYAYGKSATTSGANFNVYYHYNYVSISDTSYSSNDNKKQIINGNFKNTDLIAGTGTQGNENYNWQNFAFHALEEGEQSIEFTITGYRNSSNYIYCAIRNLKKYDSLDEMFTAGRAKKINVEYNSELGTVYYEDSTHAHNDDDYPSECVENVNSDNNNHVPGASKGLQVLTPGEHIIPYGMRFSVETAPKSEGVNSTFEPLKNEPTYSIFDGMFSGGESFKGYDVNAGSTEEARNKFDRFIGVYKKGDSSNDKLWTGYSNSIKETADAGDLKFEFKEMLPFEVNYEITDSSNSEIIKGERLPFEIAKPNSVNTEYGRAQQVKLHFKDYADFEEHYTITKTSKNVFEEKEAILVAGTDDADYYEYTFDMLDQDVKIEVKLTIDGNDKYFGDRVINFYSKVNGVDGAIGDNIRRTGSVTVEDVLDAFPWDNTTSYFKTYPWVLSPEHSDNASNNLAYIAGNSHVYSRYHTDGEELKYSLSQLKITVKGDGKNNTGTLAFELKINGYNTSSGSNPYGQLMYSTQKMEGLTEKGMAFKKEIVATCIFASAGDGKGGTFYQEAAEAAGITGLNIVDIGDGWYRLTLTVDVSNGAESIHYFGWWVKGRPTEEVDDYLVIRDVQFRQGTPQVRFSSTDNVGTVSARNLSDGSASVANGGGVSEGSIVEFTATPGTDNVFYGWVMNDKLVSTSTTYSIPIVGETTIQAVMAPANNPFVIRNNSKFYRDLYEAANAAQEGDTLLILASSNRNVENAYTLNQDVTIPAGVSLILPRAYDSDSYYTKGTESNAQTRVSWVSGKYKDPIYTLTIANGKKLTIKGTVYVGAVVHYPDQSAQGHTSGNYSQLVIEGSVEVAEGGTLDVYGRVTGNGGITVKSGGKLYQPFMILDFSGGTNTEAMFNKNITPFKMYAMINIQCANGYTIEYGGILYGHASLYFSGGITTIEQSFITYDGAPKGSDSGLLIMKSGSTVKSVYDDNHEKISGVANVEDVGKTKLTISGDVDAGYMNFLDLVQTDSVNFSLPYNYEVEIASGNFNVANHFKIMPGAVVTVDAGAKVTVKSGKSLHVYDSFYGPKFSKREYPTGDQLKTAKYNPYASLIINGTLIVEAGATFVGTVQTTDETGKATIDINATAKLSDSLFDGVATQYGCNYTSYTLTARVWDSAHNEMRNLEVGKKYVSVKASGPWTLPGIEFKYETKPSEHKSGSTGHTLETKKTADAEGLTTGSWKEANHNDHNYDWNALTSEEKNFGGAKYKVLERQCTALGCTDKEHKLLIDPNAVTLSATYKGAEFTNEEILKLFYKAVFGSETVPEDKNYFSAAVTTTTEPKDANFAGQIKISLTNGWFGDVTTTEKEFGFTVEKFDVANLDKQAIQKALADKNFTYDGLEKNITDEELKAVLKVAGLTGEVSFGAQWSNNTNAGTDTASVTVTGTGTNFTGTITINFSIAKADITVTLQKASHTYGEAPVTPDITLGGSYVKSEEAQIKAAIIRSTNATQWSNVGTSYTVTAEATEADVLKNYEISFTNNNAQLYEVKAKDITSAKATAAEVTYNGTEQKAKLSFTFERYADTEHFKENTDYTVSYAKGEETSPKNAGTYTVTITGTGNYTGSITCQYVISKKAVTVKISQQKHTFDRNKHSYNAALENAWTAEGLENSEDKSVLQVTIEGEGTDAKTYSVTCSYNNDNYTVTFEGEDSALVIEAAEITKVTVTSSHTYNGAEQKPSLKVMAGELELNEGEYNVSYNGKTVKNADTYTVTVTVKSNNFKNGDAAVTTQFKIEKKKITVTASDITGTYGDEKPEPKDFTVERGELVGNDQKEVLSVTLTLQQADNDKYVVGTEYDITGTGTADNYEITVTPGKYTVKKKAITVTANDIIGTYGDDAPSPTEFTVPEGELKYGDEESILKVTLTLATAQKYVVGTEYDITGTGTADNYEITVTPGKYTVQKKDITVTIKEQHVTYNAEQQSPKNAYTTDWTVTEQDLASGDTYVELRVTLSAEGNCLKAGSYKIKGTATSQNYNVSFTDGTGKFIIDKKEITVTASSLNLPEGTTEASVKEQLTFNVSGLYDDGNDVKNNIVVSVEYKESAKQGDTFTITVAFKDAYIPENYTVPTKNWITGILTIIDSKFKDIKFEDNKSLEYNGTWQQIAATDLPEGANATYTYAYAEAGNSLEDNKKGVKDVGNYKVTLTVTLEGYMDYTMTVNLSVTPKKITITADNVNKLYGEELVENSELTFTVPKDALVGGDDVNVLKVSLSWDHDKNVGDHQITGTATAKNYTVTVTNGIYNIKEKEITVTINKQNWATYNAKLQNAQSTVNNWSVVEGALAWHDSKETLAVTLTGSGTDAGCYEIKGKSTNGNYKVTFEGGAEAFVIAKKDISEAQIGGLEGTFTYMEAQWTPSVTVTLTGFDKLAATTDYIVEYGNNKTVAEGGTVTVKGQGNFTGEKKATFNITRKSIDGLVITIKEPEKVVYDGTQQRPEYTVSLDGYKTVDLTDAEYGTNVEAGENVGSLTLNGKDNFTGTVTVTFTIHAKSVTVTVKKQTVTYNKQLQSAQNRNEDWTVDGLASVDNASKLNIRLTASGTDVGAYDITCAWTNTNYKVTFKGADGLSAEGATIKDAFVIEAARLTEATLTSSHIYNGSEQTPTFTVKAGELTVNSGDFELTYESGADRVNAGTVTVTIKSKSDNYTGTVETQFEIKPKNIDVTLNAQSFEYSGEIPTLDNTAYTVEQDSLCSQNGKKDDLGVVITSPDAKKDVGGYTLDATASNTNYNVTFIKTQKLSVTKKHITVKANDLTSTYGESILPLTYTAEGLVENEDPTTVLQITLQASSSIKEQGVYTISGNGSAMNYDFDVENGTYTVLAKKITVTIVSHSSIYDGNEPEITQLQNKDWTVEDGAIESGDNLNITLKKELGVDFKEGGYSITGTFSNHNYEVTFVNGTYTITKREVTVSISDQSDEYGYNKNYSFNADGWSIDESTLANGEEKEVLNITLAKPNITEVGTYAITATWGNNNYNVTFIGAYNGEDNNGKAGIYTVTKKEIQHDGANVLFVLKVDDVYQNDEGEKYLYNGKEILLTATVHVKEGEKFKELECTINPEKLTEPGIYTVTVTIQDNNYEGTRTFSVEVLTSEGYSQNLLEVLEELKELVGDVTPDIMQTTEEYFDLVKEIKEQIGKLNDEEKEHGKDELEKYNEIVETWDSAAEISDAVIETAKAVADSPIKWLFAMMQISALACVMIVMGKGGLML